MQDIKLKLESLKATKIELETQLKMLREEYTNITQKLNERNISRKDLDEKILNLEKKLTNALAGVKINV